MIERYGIVIGALLLAAVTAAAVMLGMRAEAGIRRFRDEHHEQFLGEGKK